MSNERTFLHARGRPQLARNPAARPGYGSCTGWYQSLKAGQRFPYESLLERDAMLVLDTDVAVAKFAAQPDTFSWDDGGRQRQYTPDLHVTMLDGRAVYRQVKPATRFALDPTLGGRLDAIKAECAARGATHEVWLDSDIRRQPRLANARRIRAAVAFLSDDALIATLLDVVGSLPTLGAATDALGGKPEHFNMVLGLVAVGELEIDLDGALESGVALRRRGCRR